MDPLLLRFLERFAAVLIGGLSIFLGYKLFLNVPGQQDSSGKFVLPLNSSVIVSRVGPGVFFGLFGAIAVAIALMRPLDVTSEDGRHVQYAGAAPSSAADGKADARALLRKEIALLNILPKQLRPDLPEFERNAALRGLRRVKLALMKPAWGDKSEGFGEVSEFERWVADGEPDPAPSMQGAVALYRYGSLP